MFIALLLLACSDYALTEQKSVGDAFVPFVSTSDVPATPPETDDEGTGSDDTVTEEDPDDGCWFGMRQYFSSEYETGTKTLPVITVLSPSETTVSPGDEVVFKIAVSSKNHCGDFNINLMLFNVEDLSDESYVWMKQVNDAAVPSLLHSETNDFDFAPYAADNMYATPTGDELQYWWTDGTGVSSYAFDINMVTEVVEADEEKVYEFTWTASEFTPSGSTVTLYLPMLFWTDVATNQTFYSANYELIKDVEIAVHIE